MYPATPHLLKHRKNRDTEQVTLLITHRSKEDLRRLEKAWARGRPEHESK